MRSEGYECVCGGGGGGGGDGVNYVFAYNTAAESTAFKLPRFFPTTDAFKDANGGYVLPTVRFNLRQQYLALENFRIYFRIPFRFMSLTRVRARVRIRSALRSAEGFAL